MALTQIFIAVLIYLLLKKMIIFSDEQKLSLIWLENSRADLRIENVKKKYIF
jgi:hypothetical protein